MKRSRVLLGLVATVLLGTLPARAATVTLTDTWQNVGTGPLALQAFGGDAAIEASASAPTDNGLTLYKSQTPFPYNASLAIWAKRRSPSTNNAGTALTTTLVTTPIISPGGGAGGGGGPITAPLGSNTKANSVSTTFATDFLGQMTMAGSLPVVIASNQSAIPTTITGTLPAFAATPTFNIGSGSIGNTGFNALQGGAANAIGNPFYTQVTNFPTTQAVSEADGANTTLGSRADTAAGTGTVSAMQVFKQLHLDMIGPTFAAVTTSAPSYGTGTTQSLSLNVNGGLRVDGSGVTQPVSQSGAFNTTNFAVYSSALQSLSNGALSSNFLDKRADVKTSETGSDDPLVGITAVASASAATSSVGKATPGNLYRAYATATSAPAAQQYLVCINATAAPAASSAITPLDWAPFNLATVAGSTASINFGPGPPSAYSVGITCLVSTSLTTYTAGTASFINVGTR